MGLKRKLSHWQKADLISADQAKSILSHERQGIGQKYFRGLVAVALLAIFGGCALVVASNWAEIPGTLKLTVHFILNSVVAYVLWQGKESDHFWKREGGTFILGGLNLTLIALIGQVFQLNGTVESALLLWLIISTPLFLAFGQSRMNAVTWTVAFLVTAALNLHEIVDSLNIETYQQVSLYTFLAWSIPPALMLSGMSPSFKKIRHEWQDTYLITGAGLIICSGLFTSLSWYDDTDFLQREFKSLFWFPAFTAVLWGGIFMGIRHYMNEHVYKKSYQTLCLIGAITALFALIAVIPGRPEIDTLSTIHFVLYMGVIGYFAIPLGMNGLVTISVLLITLRLFIFYIELTGPMAVMGFGLIVSGILLLVGLKFALKLDKKIKAKLAAGGEK